MCVTDKIKTMYERSRVAAVRFSFSMYVALAMRTSSWKLEKNKPDFFKFCNCVLKTKVT